MAAKSPESEIAVLQNQFSNMDSKLTEVGTDVKGILTSLATQYVTHEDLTDAANALRNEFKLTRFQLWVERVFTVIVTSGVVAVLTNYINHH